MQPNSPIDETMQRTRRYWFIDGLNEISFGGVCLLLGLFFYGQAVLPPDTMAYNLLNSGFILILLGGIWATNRFVRYFKQRITYPRTGYVAYDRTRTRKQRLLAGMLTGGVASLVSVMLASAPGRVAWMPGLSGVMVAGIWLYTGYVMHLPRFYLLGAAGLVLGVALAFTGMGNEMAMGVFYGLYALVMFISGGLTLWQYLRQTSAPEAE